MSNIVITGTTSGLGEILKRLLEADGHRVIPFNLDWQGHVGGQHNCHSFANSIPVPVDVLINNAGINIIGFLEHFSSGDYDEVMNTNVKGIFNMTKAMLPALAASKGTILNIVSNAAHMPMTASFAYNASKAAAHIATLQLARELKPRHGVDVFGIAPNKLAGTGMSKSIDKQCCEVRGWTQEYAREYQLKSLPAGEETDPNVLGAFIAYLLKCKTNHKYLHGCIVPYGA